MKSKLRNLSLILLNMVTNLLYVQLQNRILFQIDLQLTLKHKQFVNDPSKELLSLGCINKVEQIPKFINPLHVAVQSSGKLRLILDLSTLILFF